MPRRKSAPRVPHLSPINPYVPLTSTIPEGARHNRCVDHIRVDGYQEPLCVERGRTRAEVLADALELSGLAPARTVRRPAAGEQVQGDQDPDGQSEQDGDAGQNDDRIGQAIHATKGTTDANP